MDLTPDKIKFALIYLGALIVSITVHEFGHAWVATRLGDPLPSAQGRVSLSPARHIDLVGTIVLPLIMVFTGAGLLGWGKPVETNRLAYTRRISPILGHVLVSLSGPLMNLLLVGIVSLLLVIGARAGVIKPSLFIEIFEIMVVLNFVLFFLNLLPLPPLDGGALLEWAMPRSPLVYFLTRWGFLILLALSMIGWLKVLLAPAHATANAWLSILVRAAGL